MHKKEFTSFDVAAVTRELKTVVPDSHISNIYQLNAKAFLLKLHQPNAQPFWLTLEAGRRLHLTAYSVEKPLIPPAFCMALRKYLRNARLTNVEQYEFERVVILSFKTKMGALRLVLELFGEGNIILISEKGDILQALSYKRMRDRNVLRGETFQFAPPTGKNPFKVTKKELVDGLRTFADLEVVRALARFLSIGGLFAEEVLTRAGVEKKKPCGALSENEVEGIFDTLWGLLSQVTSGKLEPCIVLDEAGGLLDVVPLRLKRHQAEGITLQFYPSFNQALDEFYVRVLAVEREMGDIEFAELRAEAERVKRIIAYQERVIAEAETESELDRKIGDAIYRHANELQGLLDRFLTEKERGKDWRVIISEALGEKRSNSEPWSFFKSFDAKNLVVNACIDGVTFGLDLRRTLYENAASFYERGKRTKQKLEGARAALDDSRRKLKDAETGMQEAEAKKRSQQAEVVEELSRRKVKRKEWFEKFRSFVSSDGFLVVGGRDAVTNEVLIKKHTEDDDVVFHADIIGAPFVVVKTFGKDPSEQCLREAGEFAAAFSRAWREGFGSVDVYWVRPEQLSKGGASGESVAHGAFVVRGERNWQRGVALKLAIGVVLKTDGAVTFVGGPANAVRTRANAYVTIMPGQLAGKEFLRQVLRALASKMSKVAREKVLKASIEEIREYVPFGKGKTIED